MSSQISAAAAAADSAIRALASLFSFTISEPPRALHGRLLRDVTAASGRERRPQGLVQVGAKVSGTLEADREAHHGSGDVQPVQLLLWVIDVRRERAVDEGHDFQKRPSTTQGYTSMAVTREIIVENGLRHLKIFC